MLINPASDAPASTDSAAVPPSGSSSPRILQPEDVRLLAFGTHPAIAATIKHLHKLGYAEPNDWSRPISTDRHQEVMVVLTKRVTIS